jgi:two-component system cell cycle sensor histidine kinase/response regulator CckA
MDTGPQLSRDPRQASALYRVLFENANDAILIIEPDSEKILEANPKACSLYGFSYDQLVGMSLKTLTKDVARGERQLAVLMHQGKYDLFETIHFNSSGAELHILANSAVIDYNGRSAVFTINRDVTELHRMQQALRDSEARFRSLITSSSDIIAVLGPDACLRYVSPQVETVLGYRINELNGGDMFALVHPDDAVRARAAFTTKLLGQEHVSRQELRLLHRNGAWIYFEVRGNDLTLDPGVGGIVLSVRDITERKAAEDALRRANDELEEHVRCKTKDLVQANFALQSEITGRKRTEEQLRQAQKLEAIGRLAGGVAHDFNNILTLITGYAATLLNRPDLHSDARGNVENILKAAERATSLTRQLLAFGRKQTMAPVVLDLNTVLSEFAKMLPRLLAEDIELVFNPQPGLGRVKADPAQIELAVMNLALNARDAMPGGGTLTIRTRNQLRAAAVAGGDDGVTSSDYVVVSISDTGHGMDRKTQARIFEPFFSTKGATKGTGLGLASVHGIVTQSGGSITVQSEVGQGTTFEIYLPLVDDEPVMAQEELPLLPATGTEIVLLVEDEPGIRELSRAFLEGLGYTVLLAGSGKEALKVADNYAANIDLLITDVIMPGMRGTELAAELRSRRPHMKVLYVSGFADVGITDAPVLEKPFAFDSLGAEIRHLLDRPFIPGKNRK